MPAEFGLYPRPLAEAALYGVLTALVFSLWPLARVRDIRPAALFRDLTAAPAGAWPRLGPASPPPRWPRRWSPPRRCSRARRELALATAGGRRRRARGAGWPPPAVSRRWRARLGRGRLTRGRPALRWALGALGGPSGETASVVLALGLGLGVLAAVGQIDANLRGLVTRDLPARAPAFFFVDIQNDQLAGFRERAARDPGRRATSRPRRCCAASSPGSTAARRARSPGGTGR